MKDNLKLICATALLWICALSVNAQFSQSPTVLANCGGEGDTLGYKMQWTVGELVIESLGNSMFHLTQGFHQPFVVPVVQGVGLEELVKVNNATIWPNPTQEELNIRFSTPLRNEVNASIVGLDGRTLRTRLLMAGSSNSVISVGDLAPGGYLLVLAPKDTSHPSIHRFIKIIQ